MFTSSVQKTTSHPLLSSGEICAFKIYGQDAPFQAVVLNRTSGEGVLRASSPVDCESQKEYTFIIQAYDCGAEPSGADWKKSHKWVSRPLVLVMWVFSCPRRLKRGLCCVGMCLLFAKGSWLTTNCLVNVKIKRILIMNMHIFNVFGTHKLSYVRKLTTRQPLTVCYICAPQTFWSLKAQQWKYFFCPTLFWSCHIKLIAIYPRTRLTCLAVMVILV